MFTEPRVQQQLPNKSKVDDGVVLETDPITIAQRVSKPPVQDITSVKGIDLSEQGLLNAWEFAKMKGLERLRQGL